MQRIEKIVAEVENCEVFADVGCDHGYVALGVLKSGKCKSAIISDVSPKCLKKAEDLLSEYIKNGKVKSVVSDGFSKIGTVDSAVIAGMGGEEIVSILTSAKTLPDKMVLQPMKNCDKVRVTLINLGYRIVKDFVFFSDKKFYNLIVTERGKDVLTKEEIEFGRTNLLERPRDFKKMIREEIKKLQSFSVVENVSENAKNTLNEKIERLQKYV